MDRKIFGGPTPRAGGGASARTFAAIIPHHRRRRRARGSLSACLFLFRRQSREFVKIWRVSPSIRGSRGPAGDRCHQTAAFERISMLLSSLQFTFHFSSCIFISADVPFYISLSTACLYFAVLFYISPYIVVFFPPFVFRVRSIPRPSLGGGNDDDGGGGSGGGCDCEQR